MSNSRTLVDFPLLYEYLTMNVEDAEYPTAVPLCAIMLASIPFAIGVQQIGRFFFSSEHTHHTGRAFLDLDGVEEACDGCLLKR